MTQYLAVFSVTTNTHFMNSFIRWQLVSTINSGLHQAVIQEYEYTEKLNNISWRSPRFKLKVH